MKKFNIFKTIIIWKNYFSIKNWMALAAVTLSLRDLRNFEINLNATLSRNTHHTEARRYCTLIELLVVWITLNKRAHLLLATPSLFCPLLVSLSLPIVCRFIRVSNGIASRRVELYRQPGSRSISPVTKSSRFPSDDVGN